MSVDGALRDDKLSGYLLVSHPFGNKGSDVTLAACQHRRSLPLSNTDIDGFAECVSRAFGMCQPTSPPANHFEFFLPQ